MDDAQRKRPRELAVGCLGEGLGEFAMLAVLALLGGLFLLMVRAGDELARSNPATAALVAIPALAFFFYGLTWTVRVKPGLYLEHLKGDDARQARLATGNARLRKFAMLYFQIVCALPVGYAVTLLVWR